MLRVISRIPIGGQTACACRRSGPAFAAFGRLFTTSSGLVEQQLNDVANPSKVKCRAEGQPETLLYRVHFHDVEKHKSISPWHNLPLFPTADDTWKITYVNEIPRGTRAKYEISKQEAGNPIKQDIKNQALRFFSYGPIPFNYGFAPQTYSNPNIPEFNTTYKGDGDPIDVVEIGATPLPIGAVEEVRVLGALALIDSGEMDWKLVCLRLSDPRIAELDEDRRNMDHVFPGMLSMTREWFRNYKTVEGKAPNIFEFNERFLDRKVCTEVLKNSHKQWQQLRIAQLTSPEGSSA